MIFPQPRLTKKIKSLTKYPKPTNQKEQGSFLRTACYHRKFVHALKKSISTYSTDYESAQLKWGKEERDAFNCIKQCLMTKPILGFPNFRENLSSIRTQQGTA